MSDTNTVTPVATVQVTISAPEPPVSTQEVAEVVTPAHFQKDSSSLIFYYPPHEPRETDKHYKLFNHVHDMIIAHSAGCKICHTKEHLEVHHAKVEFAAALGVDEDQLKADYPEYGLTDKESFLDWIETSPDNLMVLCAYHHRSPGGGIHCVPFPNWQLQEYWQKELPPPVQSANKAIQDASIQTVTVTTDDN